MPNRPEEILKAPYTRILIPDENGTYFAGILEFPGCVSQGETPDEAIRNLEEAAVDWIQATLEQGQSIPEPEANVDYGGKFALRLPRSLHRHAAQLAKLEGVSLNQFLVSAIAARVGAEDLYNRMVQDLEWRVRALTGNEIMPGDYAMSLFRAFSPSKPLDVLPNIIRISGPVTTAELAGGD